MARSALGSKIVLIAVALVAIIILFYFLKQPGRLPGPYPTPSFVPSASPTPSPSPISDLLVPSCKEKFDEAWNEKNALLCEDISCLDLKSYCRIEVGREEGLGECAKITDEKLRDPCYQVIAVNTKNASVCSYIVDGDRRIACVVLITGDASLCAGMSVSRDLCYFFSVQVSKNASVCSSIVSEDMKTDCLNAAGVGG